MRKIETYTIEVVRLRNKISAQQYRDRKKSEKLAARREVEFFESFHREG